MSEEKNESRSSVSSGTKQEKEAVKSEAPTPLASSTPQIQTPYSLQFWDEAPEIGKARKIYITILLQRTLIIVLAIFGIFSIYWGALWQLPARSLEGWIVVSRTMFTKTERPLADGAFIPRISTETG